MPQSIEQLLQAARALSAQEKVQLYQTLFAALDNERLMSPEKEQDEDRLSERCDLEASVPSDIRNTVHQYRMMNEIARGGMAQVYFAQDEDLGRKVTLAQMQVRFADSKDLRSRYLREPRARASLEHAGIVPIYGIGRDSTGLPFYVERFIQGECLSIAIRRYHQLASDKRNRQERALALRRLLGQFVDVCNTIACAHSHGLLHRDIKPDNITIGRYGETFVVEWRLAKVFARRDMSDTATECLAISHPNDDDCDDDATAAGVAFGTIEYMSPEQAAASHDLTGPASDIFNLGATLYHLLTGNPPYSGTHSAAIGSAQQGLFRKPRERKPDIPPALESICLKAMALNPEDRYETPTALADDIERWLAGVPVSAFEQPKLWKRFLGG
jgi:eukaryotic-like serine/threonine-protein kinase